MQLATSHPQPSGHGVGYWGYWRFRSKLFKIGACLSSSARCFNCDDVVPEVSQFKESESVSKNMDGKLECRHLERCVVVFRENHSIAHRFGQMNLPTFMFFKMMVH